MPDSSPSPAAPASSGSRDAVLARASSGVNRPQKRQVRLLAAEASRSFAAPLQHQTRQRRPKNQEIPASADVAQLVEHFTRNEGVGSSSLPVGSRSPRYRVFRALLGSISESVFRICPEVLR
jgi:hypothetical protein